MVEVPVAKDLRFLQRLKTAASVIADGFQKAIAACCLVPKDEVFIYQRHEKLADLTGRDGIGRFRLLEAVPSTHEAFSRSRSIAWGMTCSGLMFVPGPLLPCFRIRCSVDLTG